MLHFNKVCLTCLPFLFFFSYTRSESRSPGTARSATSNHQLQGCNRHAVYPLQVFPTKLRSRAVLVFAESVECQSICSRGSDSGCHLQHADRIHQKCHRYKRIRNWVIDSLGGNLTSIKVGNEFIKLIKLYRETLHKPPPPSVHKFNYRYHFTHPLMRIGRRALSNEVVSSISITNQSASQPSSRAAVGTVSLIGKPSLLIRQRL